MIEKRPFFVLFATFFAALPQTAIASDATDGAPAIVRGTDGLARLSFRARNLGAEPIACAVATAHWYTMDLGSAGPGGVVQGDFWVSVPTGETFVLNDARDRMPVQALWCGFAGRAWTSRSPVVLDRRAGRTPAAIALDCDRDGEHLRCR